jgi:cysteine desulfurase
MDRDARHVKRLYYKLLNGIKEKLPEVYLNGDETSRYYGNLNLSFAFVEGER